MTLTDNTILVNIQVTKENGFGETRHEVVIKVYQDGNEFFAIPCLEDGERRALRLPNAFNFQCLDQCIIPAKGTNEEHVDLMKQIIMGIS